MDVVGTTLALTTLTFPPGIIGAVMFQLANLCKKIRTRYMRHKKALDQALLHIRQCVQELERSLEHLARLGIQVKDPNALECLLNEADEVCAKYLADARKGKARVTAVVTRVWIVIRHGRRRELVLSGVKGRLDHAASELAVLVRATEATGQSAGSTARRPLE